MERDLISLIERKVKVLMAENNVTTAKLCEAIGMTTNGYNKMWKNRSIKVETIQKIAAYFKITPDELLSNQSNTYQIKSSGPEVEEMREKYIKALESENELLKKLLGDKK